MKVLLFFRLQRKWIISSISKYYSWFIFLYISNKILYFQTLIFCSLGIMSYPIKLIFHDSESIPLYLFGEWVGWGADCFQEIEFFKMIIMCLCENEHGESCRLTSSPSTLSICSMRSFWINTSSLFFIVILARFSSNISPLMWVLILVKVGLALSHSNSWYCREHPSPSLD